MSSPVVVLIPVYRPSVGLIDLVRNLLAAGLDRVVLVDDGSPSADEAIFAEIRQLPGVNYLRHDVNLGKGAALKTGFKFICEYFSTAVEVVTADADGQHTVGDITKVATLLNAYPNQLILGVRDFAGKLPWRSWFGNTLTRKIFGWLTGQRVSDTQTGLRGIPISWLPWLINLPGYRYEYEINMLLEAKRRGLLIVEEPITTLYEAGNPSSHFNPVFDSFKVYWVLLRYVVSSLITAGVDVLLFSYLIQWWGNITLSILVSRWVVGAGVNFTLNRSLVFRSGSVIWPVLFRYYLVISVMGLAASWLISWLVRLTGLPVIYSKIIIEVALFPVGFILQKRLVFTFIASEVE